MTNKIFLNRQKKVNHLFRKYHNQFIKMIKNNPQLKTNIKNVDINARNIFYKFSNSLIYFYCSENDISIRKDHDFSLRYFNVLRTIYLIAFSVKNNEQINLFNYDFEFKKSPNSLLIHKLDIPNEYIELFNRFKDEFYSYIYYLYRAINFDINFSKFYSLIKNIIIMFMIKNDMYFYKRIWGYRIKVKQNYSTSKTKAYLEMFKIVKKQLLEVLPEMFNDLIFVFNSI